MTVALWIIAGALVALLLVAVWAVRIYASGPSRLDMYSDVEIADRLAPHGQGVQGVPMHAPLNGSLPEDKP